MNFFLCKSKEHFFHSKEINIFSSTHRNKLKKEHQFTWNHYNLDGLISNNTFDEYHFKNQNSSNDLIIDMNDINNNLLERENNTTNHQIYIRLMPEGVSIIPFTKQELEFGHTSRLSSYYHKKSYKNIIANTYSPEPTPNNSPEKERRLL